ncbi:MAG TPA: E3 binding domain-containing protein [Solirubrobacterales bacterium]|jgi:hypothetical protein
MAQQTKRREDRKESRRTGDEGSKRSPLNNLPEDGSVPEREYRNYTMLHPGSISDTDEPDVLLDIPVVKVEEIHVELDDIEARVSLHAEVLDLVKLSVGVHAELGKVQLTIKGVEAQAMLRVRLDHVTAIIDRVLTTIDRNPQLLESIGRSVEQIGAGAGEGVGRLGRGAGRAVEEVGEGAEGAVKEVGKGAGGAVQEVGRGAGGAVRDVGKGAGGAVEEVGGGAGQAVGQVGEGAGQAVGGVGQGAGQAIGGIGRLGVGAAGSQGGNGGGTAVTNGSHAGGSLAKEIAKVVAEEIKAAASDEVKDLSLAATQKAKELGERRREKRAMKHNATPAALLKAEELGVDIDEVEGTGAGGRVTVHDVEKAARH